MNASNGPIPRPLSIAHRQSIRHLGFAIVTAALITLAACGSTTPTTIEGAPTISAATSAPPNRDLSSTSGPGTTTPPVNTMASSTVASSAVSVTTIPRPTATIDELIGVAGKRMHIRCVGQGATTVLLIAGFGGDASGWSKIEPAITARARVCSYERPGTGTSDPATSTQTFSTQAAEVHALLTNVGEPGPYVVVGHSFGGAEAVSFASLFAGEVTGLVLIDASPTTWPSAMCAVPDDGTAAAAMLRGLCTGAFTPTGNTERLDVAAAFGEVSAITSLGALPMAVITATNREFPNGLAAPEMERLVNTWNQGQHQWMALSAAAHLVSVDHTGHHIEIDQPGVVIDEITRLLP